MTARPTTLDYARPAARSTRARATFAHTARLARRMPRWAWAATLAGLTAFAAPPLARAAYELWPAEPIPAPTWLWCPWQWSAALAAGALFLAGPIRRRRRWEFVAAPLAAVAALLSAAWWQPPRALPLGWNLAATAGVVLTTLAIYEWLAGGSRRPLSLAASLVAAGAAATLAARLALPRMLSVEAPGWLWNGRWPTDGPVLPNGEPWPATAVVLGGVAFMLLLAVRRSAVAAGLAAVALLASAAWLHDYHVNRLLPTAAASLGGTDAGGPGPFDRRLAVRLLADAGPAWRGTLYDAAVGRRELGGGCWFGVVPDASWRNLAFEVLVARDGAAGVDRLVAALKRDPHPETLVSVCALLPPRAVRSLAPELLRLAAIDGVVWSDRVASRLLYRAGVPQAYELDGLNGLDPGRPGYPGAAHQIKLQLLRGGMAQAEAAKIAAAVVDPEGWPATPEAWHQAVSADPPGDVDAGECGRVLAAARRARAVGSPVSDEPWLTAEGTEAFVAGAEGFAGRLGPVPTR